MTLIEIAIATAILGLGATALMIFFGSVTRTNIVLNEQGKGINIARSGHEWAASRSFVNLVDAFKDGSIENSTPKGAGGELPDPSSAGTYAGYSQRITMRRVNESDISAPGASTSRILEVTVTALRNNTEVFTLKKLYSNPLSSASENPK